jgi:TPR repeat protein
MRRGDAARSAEDTWQLGLRSYTGVGATKDEREAVRLFRIAADAGHAAAQAMLGVAYRHGEGVGPDYEKAITVSQPSRASPRHSTTSHRRTSLARA